MENTNLSVRAHGQVISVHVPVRPPEPLTLGKLVSLTHVLLTRLLTRLEKQMTAAAQEHRNYL
eukprot:786607-Amphidinium_carterae.1